MGEIYHILIKGAVQGVGLRYHVFNWASSLGLVGFVKNLSNGQVEILIAGKKSDLDRFINWISNNPGQAKIDEITVLKPKNVYKFVKFEILY